MTQNEARIETLRALLGVAYDPAAPMSERAAAWFRFKAICGYYQINPRSFNIPRQIITVRRDCMFPPPTRPLLEPQLKKARIMRAQQQPDPTPNKRNQKTVHKDCTHGDSKTDRAKCRRHKEKEAEKQG